MRIAIIVTVLSIFIIQCSSKNEKNILEQPPFGELTDSINLFPQNSALYYKRGVLLYQQEHRELAKNDLLQAWQLAPQEDYALSLTTLLKQQHTDSAINFLQRATQTLPSSIALQIGLARGYQQKNDHQKALEICNNIISQFPNQLDALVLKAEILQKQNKTAEAISTLEQAWSFAPFDIDIAHELAYAYAEAKNKKVLALTDTLIKYDQSEKAAIAWYIKGLYYDNSGAKQEAIKNYDQAIRHNYTLLDPYLAKGQALYDLKKWDEAITTFQLGQKVSPTTADFFYWIGKTQEATGNKQEAKQNYERAYQLDKTMTEAKQAADKL